MSGLGVHAEVAVLAFAVAPALGLRLSRTGPFVPFTVYWAIAAACGVITTLVVRDRADALVFAVSLLAALLWDWWRRNGKRVAKAAGAKSRALLADLAERAREAGTPVPRGAGA